MTIETELKPCRFGCSTDRLFERAVLAVEKAAQETAAKARDLIAEAYRELDTRPSPQPDQETVERVASAIALRDGLNWTERCAYEADPDADECDSSTCVAAHFEDHDPDWARTQYRGYASAAIAALNPPPGIGGEVVKLREARAARTIPSFEDAWARKEEEGYIYGPNALENVRLGFEMAIAALSTPSEQEADRG